MAAETLCKKKNNMNLEEQEKFLLVVSAGGDLAQNIHNNSQATRRLPVTGEPPSVATAIGDPVPSCQNNGLPEKKEVVRSEFEKFPKSKSLVIWKMNFKSEVSLLQLKFFQQKPWCMTSIPPGIYELKWSSSILGRIVPDFEVLD